MNVRMFLIIDCDAEEDYNLVRSSLHSYGYKWNSNAGMMTINYFSSCNSFGVWTDGTVTNVKKSNPNPRITSKEFLTNPMSHLKGPTDGYFSLEDLI